MTKQATVKLEIAEPIRSALKRGGYRLSREDLGSRPGGAKANKYWVATKGTERIALSLKNQSGAGSAEQKIPFEEGVIRTVLFDNRLKSDMVHPNGQGYAQIAAAVEKVLRKAGAL